MVVVVVVVVVMVVVVAVVLLPLPLLLLAAGCRFRQGAAGGRRCWQRVVCCRCLFLFVDNTFNFFN